MRVGPGVCWTGRPDRSPLHRRPHRPRPSGSLGRRDAGGHGEGCRSKKKESPTIAGLLGYALGCVGMRLDDFERMTPDEFSAVCEAHAKTREADSRESWEQTRALAYTLSGPYMKHKTTVQRFWPLPWDEKKEKRGADRVVMSREEQKRRFEELARRG